MTIGDIPAPRPLRDPADLTAWVVTDGKAGTENQAVGLAEAVGIPFIVKRLQPRASWRWLPPAIWLRLMGDRFGATLRPGDRFAPPWPNLLIAASRIAVPYAIAAKRASGTGTFVVFIQDPRVSPAHFDLVVPPRHDGLSGRNVVATRGALTRVTPERLAEGARRFAPLLAPLGRPLVAVLIGGSNRAYRMTPAAMDDLIAKLETVMASGAALALTASRRTGPAEAARLRAALAGKRAFMWDGIGDNPYFGLLGLADAIVVTADSVSMTSEACATGKPVYVAALPGGSAKFQAFHEALAREGYTRPFTGEIAYGSGKTLDETAAIAALIAARLALRS